MSLTMSVRFPTPEMVEMEGKPVRAVWVFRQRDDDGEWPSIEARIEVHDGVPEIRDLRITSTRDGMPIKAGHLRGLNLENLIEYAGGAAHERSAVWDNLPEGESSIYRSDIEDAVREGQQSVRRSRRDARRTVTNELLVEVAGIYSAARHAPVQAVARHFNKSQRTATNWIRLARERDLLTDDGS